jgi:peroxiredoxin Q/BCP
MVELRKRKTPPPAPGPAPKKERKTKATKAAADEKSEDASGPVKAGDKINLEGFGGQVESNDGGKVTLKSLVEESKDGVVLFTYPKASTPGCRFLVHICCIMS